MNRYFLILLTLLISFSHQSLLADFNGDGRTDIMRLDAFGGSQTSIYYSNGNGFNPRVDGPQHGVSNSIEGAARIMSNALQLGANIIARLPE